MAGPDSGLLADTTRRPSLALSLTARPFSEESVETGPRLYQIGVFEQEMLFVRGGYDPGVIGNEPSISFEVSTTSPTVNRIFA